MTPKTGQKTLLSTNPYLELNNQGQILHLELQQQRHILGRDAIAADLVVPDDWQVISGCQAVLRKDGEDYCIYDGDGHKPSTNKLYVNHARITPVEGYRLTNGIQIQIGQNPENLIQLKYYNPSSVEQVTSLQQRSLSLKQKSVLLGRDDNANLRLDAPTVSRRHATIDTDATGRYILQDHSTNGVFVNSQRVSGSAVLPPGATIKIGPFTLVLRGDELQILDRGNQIRLDAYGLVIESNNKRRLDDVSFAIEPGQFVALVGGSGAGKSTLMRSLLGIEPLTKGVVYLNGEDLRNNFNIYRTQIGYVPQDDIIHRELTVAEVLTYAAKLRLPPDTDVEIVQQALEQIKMSDRRDAMVRQLSGGQRKRVSIGVELLADPKLFFLDEPTSGLDPGLDKQMMQLLKELAHQGGRTIVLVTHATANITQCDRILFLGIGGRLCYFGTPTEALDFFGVKDFADIYIKLNKEEEVIKAKDNFKKSSYCQRYIGNHLSPGNQQHLANIPPTRKQVSFWQQLSLLSQRYLQLVQRDSINLALVLFTAPLGISLITLAIGNKTPFVSATPPNDFSLAPLALRVLFVFTCAALWVGLASSLQEIVKESAIYLRERLVNLGLFAYLSSKVTVLSGLAVLQTLLMMAVILIGFKAPPTKLIPWSLGLFITIFLTLLASFSLGLLVSAIVKNGSQANSALPLLLLPQIIFSGVLFKMEGVASKFSWIMLSRWSVGAYGALVNVNAMVPKGLDGPLPNLPFEGSDVYNLSWENLSLNWGILLLHAAFYLTVTFWLQKRKDIF